MNEINWNKEFYYKNIHPMFRCVLTYLKPKLKVYLISNRLIIYKTGGYYSN